LKQYNLLMPKAQKQMRSGFSLIEIILVVALTLFLLTVTATGFVNSASQFAFANAYQRVLDMISTARSYAISGKAQLDYTDYAGNFLHPMEIPSNYVTPAHYGINFDTTDATKQTVTLFADLHSNVSGMESQYFPAAPANIPTDYKDGKDIILDQYTLPQGMNIVLPSIPPSSSAKAITIFYSPIFADISFDVSSLPTDPFFKFGIQQTSGAITRNRCSEIHKMAGIAEPFDCPS